MTNEEIVQEIRAGRQDLIEQLWQQVRDFVYLYANRWDRAFDGRDGNTADDYAHSAFLALYPAVASYNADKGMTFVGWFKNYMLDAFTKAARVRTTKGKGELQYHLTSLNAAISGKDGDAAERIALIEDVTAAASLQAVDAAIEREQFRRIYDIVAAERLTPRQREIMQLRYFDDRTCEEIGQQLGVSRQAVNFQEQAALATIRKSPSAMRQLEQFR